MTSAVSSERLRRICADVWRDRAEIVLGRGVLSGEAALERAVYWRLCKEGGEPDEMSADYETSLEELARRYRDEAARNC